MNTQETWSPGIIGLIFVIGVLALGAIVVTSVPGFRNLGETPSDPTDLDKLADAHPLLAQLDEKSDSTPVVDAEQPAIPAPVVTAKDRRRVRLRGLIDMLTIFAVSVFVGFEVITKVPPTLHTPLMSGSNAISGITIVGAVVVATSLQQAAALPAMFAVLLAAINVVGGFLVTHRMLSMFKKK